MRKFLVAAAVALAALFPAPVSAVTPDPVTCAGYPEPRVGVEIQAWWRDRTGEAFPGRHIHVFTCWPTGVVTGTVRLDMKVQTHAQPAGAYVSRLRIKDAGKGDLWAVTSGFTSLDENGDMVQWISKDVVTTGLTTGLHEMQLAAYVRQPGGFDQFVTSGLPLFVRSMSGGSTSRDYVEARGWYPGFEYHNARYKVRLSDFLTPKSGIWKPTFQCASPSGQPNATYFIGNVDPHWHDLDGGTRVWLATSETTVTPSIDTTQFVNGPHKIVAGCEANGNLSGHDGFNRGVLAIDFQVQN